MVEVPVDLLGLTIAPQQTTEDPHASHPEELLGHTGVLGTLPLTVSGVAALPSGLRVLPDSGSGVDGDGLLDDEAIADQLSDVLAGVGVGDLIDLVGIEPNLLLAALHDGGGKPLL